ncbi:chromate transporter [Peribacillus glennii]|uniref:Chromate transporter n=1 Tax=Peribacillus glennii TaxID=2303991 RepID=A0A372LD37_9BACI|nr:chromate transporter [Peribacillus glennii]RFU63935.1 chromate transporter [Peribacillus glennii]
MKQRDIFMAFFRAGMLGYGGGPSSIPLVKKEVVDRYKWMEADEFGDVLALANALPGPIATKLAGYIGYRVGGFRGLLNGLIGTMVPTIFLMILLMTALNSYKDQPWVEGMSKAVIPVVAVMLLTMTWEFFKKSTQSSLGWVGTFVFVVVSLVLIQAVHIHPAIIIFALLLGALLKKNSPAKEKGTPSP